MIWFPSYDIYIIGHLGFQEILFLYCSSGKLKSSKKRSRSYTFFTRAHLCSWWKEEISQTQFMPWAWWQFTAAWQCCHPGNFCCQQISLDWNTSPWLLSLYLLSQTQPAQHRNRKKNDANYSLVMTVVGQQILSYKKPYQESWWKFKRI